MRRDMTTEGLRNVPSLHYSFIFAYQEVARSGGAIG